MIRDLTQGNVMTQLILFATPLFFSNVLQAVYNIVDMIVVGRVLGGSGLSAVSIGGDILHLMTFIAMGFSSAGQVIISQYVGAHRSDSIRKLIGTMFTSLIAASITIATICFFFRASILHVLNTPAESYRYTMDYTVTCMAGLPFIYGYNIVSAILRGMGDSRRPFFFISIAAVLNTVLDILFVVVLHMGPFGAALATVVGQAVSFLVSVVYLYRRREHFGFDFKLKSFQIYKDQLKPLVALGIPMAIQSAAINISRVILMAWINQYGVVYSAVSGLYHKIGMICGLTANAFTTAGSAMVGQSIGASKYDRVPHILGNICMIGIVIAGFFSAMILLFSEQVYQLFTSDVEVLSIAPILILPLLLFFLGSAGRSFGFSLINGSGNSKLNLIIALIDGCVARIGCAAFLGYGLHLKSYGFLLGDAIAGFMPFIIGITFFVSGKWRTNRHLIKHSRTGE